MSYFYLVIVAITAYEVIMRYVLLQPTIWVHDLAVALCALGFVFGGPVALSARQHIAITALYEISEPEHGAGSISSTRCCRSFISPLWCGRHTCSRFRPSSPMR